MDDRDGGNKINNLNNINLNDNNLTDQILLMRIKLE